MDTPLQQKDQNHKHNTGKLINFTLLAIRFQRLMRKDGTARLKFINSQENNVYYIKYVLSGL
jgi:hypothetical protein